jgi:hypothetical protein
MHGPFVSTCCRTDWVGGGWYAKAHAWLPWPIYLKFVLESEAALAAFRHLSDRCSRVDTIGSSFEFSRNINDRDQFNFQLNWQAARSKGTFGSGIRFVSTTITFYGICFSAEFFILAKQCAIEDSDAASTGIVAEM